MGPYDDDDDDDDSEDESGDLRASALGVLGGPALPDASSGGRGTTGFGKSTTQDPAERVARLAIYNVIGGCTLYIQREVGVDVVYTTYILNIKNAYLMVYMCS